MLADASNGWGFAGSLVAVIGGIVYLIVQQRGARNAASEAAVLASATKATVEDTKATAEETQSIISDVASNFDSATMAGLLADASRLLTNASGQLARCQDENRQLVAIVKTMERKLAAHERELVSLRSALDGMSSGAPPAAGKRASRSRKQAT